MTELEKDVLIISLNNQVESLQNHIENLEEELIQERDAARDRSETHESNLDAVTNQYQSFQSASNVLYHETKTDSEKIIEMKEILFDGRGIWGY